LEQQRFDQLLLRLKANKVTRWWERRGCSSSDIRALEDHYAISLPTAYRWYLTTLGHRSGRLFRHDHLAVDLGHVLHMTEHVRKRMAQDGAESQLPDNALVILGRLGAYFQFIRCDNGTDSPVWELHEDDWLLSADPIHQSTIEWLEFWTAEAESAIRTGYFRWLPGGTSP